MAARREIPDPAVRTSATSLIRRARRDIPPPDTSALREDRTMIYRSLPAFVDQDIEQNVSQWIREGVERADSVGPWGRASRS
jgi:hypothetical protein